MRMSRELNNRALEWARLREEEAKANGMAQDAPYHWQGQVLSVSLEWHGTPAYQDAEGVTWGAIPQVPTITIATGGETLLRLKKNKKWRVLARMARTLARHARGVEQGRIAPVDFMPLVHREWKSL